MNSGKSSQDEGKMRLGPDGPNRPTNRFATGIALVLRTDAFEERDGTEETVRQHMGVGGRVMLANTR